MIEVLVWTDGNNTLTQSLLVCRNGRLFFSKELDHNKRHIETSLVAETTAYYYGTLRLRVEKI